MPDPGFAMFLGLTGAALLLTVILLRPEYERWRQSRAMRGLIRAVRQACDAMEGLGGVLRDTEAAFRNYAIALREADDAEAELLPRPDL